MTEGTNQSAHPGEPEQVPTIYEERGLGPAADSDYPLQPSFGDDSPDWRLYLHRLWQGRWWLLLATALGIGAGFYLARQTDPVYETQATVWLESKNDGSGPIEGEDVLQGQGWSDLFKSRTVLEPVARNLKLILQPEAPYSRRDLLFQDFEATSETLPGEYRLEIRSPRYTLTNITEDSVERGRLEEEPIGEAMGFRWSPNLSQLKSNAVVEFRLASTTGVALRLRDRLHVLFNPDLSNIIETRFEWHDPKQGARIHDAILDTFLQTAYRIKTQKLQEVVNILERQTNYTASRLDSAELALENFRVNTITLPRERGASAPASEEGETGMNPVFQRYFDRQLRVNELETEIARLQKVLDRLDSEGKLDVLKLRLATGPGNSPELERALDQLTKLRAERNSLLLTYTEKHPSVQRLTQKIETLKTSTIPSHIRDLSQELQSQLTNMRQQLAGQSEELRAIPERSIREARLERNMEMAERLHKDLLVRKKQAELAAVTNLPNLQVVDKATIPEEPSRNDAPRFFVLASVAGLGLGIGGVLLFSQLDQSVQTPEQVNRALGLPVLGMVPRITDKEPDDRETLEVVESFRAIRGQLARASGERTQVILITSPEPRAGKSLVATNLAISFATSGKLTLLIDADTRRGNVDKFFELQSKPGLTDCLAGRVHVDDAVRATDMDGLSVLVHGELRRFDADLLDSPRMDDLLELTRSRFDVVVVDGPPLAAGVDPMLLGERSDKVVLVLRTGATNGAHARASLESVGNFDFPVVGTVLNAVPTHAPYYSGYYYSYPREGRVEVVASS